MDLDLIEEMLAVAEENWEAFIRRMEECGFSESFVEGAIAFYRLHHN